jgi:transposase-like protein
VRSNTWRFAWNEFVPFLDYPVELRKTVYTTNAIESINFQLRKITKNRGHFPDKDAAMKLLYLGLRNISSERGRIRHRHTGLEDRVEYYVESLAWTTSVVLEYNS